MEYFPAPMWCGGCHCSIDQVHHFTEVSQRSHRRGRADRDCLADAGWITGERRGGVLERRWKGACYGRNVAVSAGNLFFNQILLFSSFFQVFRGLQGQLWIRFCLYCGWNLFQLPQLCWLLLQQGYPKLHPCRILFDGTRIKLILTSIAIPYRLGLITMLVGLNPRSWTITNLLLATPWYTHPRTYWLDPPLNDTALWLGYHTVH